MDNINTRIIQHDQVGFNPGIYCKLVANINLSGENLEG